MKKHPNFSIICPAFNHEKYVASFINSVLAQTVTDWELVIVDDCSSDNTAKIIKTYKDKRIKFIQHKINSGINVAINTGLENACGEIYVFVASDDVMSSNALEKIGEAFHKNPDAVAVYCNLEVIDENNKPRTDVVMTEMRNRSRAELLHEAFFNGNVLNGPGMSMLAKYGQKLYPATPANCNFQDYIQNVQLLIMGNIFIVPEKIIKYRIPHDKKNISASGFNTNMREVLEIDSLMDIFLDIKDINLLNDIFKNEINETGVNINKTQDIKYFLGNMALLSSNMFRQMWGYHSIMDCYNQNRNKLFHDYKFEFRNLIGFVNMFKQPKNVFVKYNKYKRLFNLMLITNIVLVCGIILYVVIK